MVGGRANTGSDGVADAPGRGTTDPVTVAAVQARTVRTLVAGQVLGGLGIGATVSVGAVLAAHVSGSDALSGMAATFTTLGAAAAAVPLGRLVQRYGRRTALTTGAATSAVGAAIIVAAEGAMAFPLLLVGFALLGVGSAVNLQSRFAATDLADPAHRGRTLSIVVWSTTIGAVVGPNLVGPGEVVSGWFGMMPLAGPFIIGVAAQLAAAALYLVALRPDPYLLSRTLPQAPPAVAEGSAVRARTLVILTIVIVAVGHAVMVSVMSMTPVHLQHHGSTLGAVGFTISLHVAGMYALSPVFGWLSDRLGRFGTILIGQAFFAAGLAVVGFGELDQVYVTIGLVFIGLGWSATTVSGSALISDLVTGTARPRIQARSDLSMNIAGAAGGALAGPVLALVGYAGLAAVAGALVLATVIAVLIVAPRGSRMTGAGASATP